MFVSAEETFYYNASEFSLLGKGVGETYNMYSRLPDSLSKVVRKQLFDLGQNSAGMSIRFATNSTEIHISWKSLNGFRMNHMTSAGVRGLDLYVLDDNDGWVFAGTARPTLNKMSNKSRVIYGMKPKMREYMLFLSLYDGVTNLEIGVDSNAVIEKPNVNLPKEEKPVVLYGTSIMQGGCASRPGMAHTNILQRRLNREMINLGFSGNAHLDYEVAEVMANIDAGMFVIDCLPNCKTVDLYDRYVNFFRIIRDKNPDVPVLMIESPIFPQLRFNDEEYKIIEEKNKALKEIYDGLVKSGEKEIYYLKGDDILGHDGEGTVDGIHFTDLGFMRYADLLEPIIKKHVLK